MKAHKRRAHAHVFNAVSASSHCASDPGSLLCSLAFVFKTLHAANWLQSVMDARHKKCCNLLWVLLYGYWQRYIAEFRSNLCPRGCCFVLQIACLLSLCFHMLLRLPTELAFVPFAVTSDLGETSRVADIASVSMAQFTWLEPRIPMLRYSHLMRGADATRPHQPLVKKAGFNRPLMTSSTSS
eukprot:6192289-Pleurochrysis_carterae.AAC.1